MSSFVQIALKLLCEKREKCDENVNVLFQWCEIMANDLVAKMKMPRLVGCQRYLLKPSVNNEKD